ncbi:hypothetical protein ACIBAI_10685 [Streptomyces sp. NPDC051041]|uniref:hypothetical protein n=1 Tax=Streptomyces sp. NPDC051041 TaxID=3365640 RepID=UPI0037B0C7DB
MTLLSAALLAACAQGEPKPTHPTRSAAEAAWHTSTPEQRRAYCDAYSKHDPQHPIEVPTHQSAETNEEFADDFYEVLKKQC